MATTAPKHDNYSLANRTIARPGYLPSLGTFGVVFVRAAIPRNSVKERVIKA